MTQLIGGSRRARFCAFILIALGWAISAYLWLNPSRNIGPFPVLGIGLAAWGMLYFAVIGFLLTVQNPRFTAVAFVVAAMGFGANLLLALPVLNGLVRLCPICLLVPATAASLLILLCRLSRTAPLPWA